MMGRYPIRRTDRTTQSNAARRLDGLIVRNGMAGLAHHKVAALDPGSDL